DHVAVSQDGNRVFGFFLGYVGSSHRYSFHIIPGDSENLTTVPALSSAAPTVGVWTHLTGVYDAGAGQVRLYVDGELAGTGPCTSAAARRCSTGRRATWPPAAPRCGPTAATR